MHRPFPSTYTDPVKARETILKNKAERQERKDDQRNIVIGGVALFLLVISAVKGVPLLEDMIYEADISGGGLNLFDVVAALMWSCSLWFVSPWQMLVLFFGMIETERPSDWLMSVIARTAGLPVDEVDYVHPTPVRVGAMAITVASGFLIAYSLEKSLGDPTWALSSGIATLMAAGIYEIGRPTRLTKDEAVLLEAQWQDFKLWADERCVPYGRAHQTEVINAFRKENRKYNSSSTLNDDRILDMIRNWHPTKLDRSGSGYLRNMSLQARRDPFTGQMTGNTGPAPAPRPAANSTPGEAAQAPTAVVTAEAPKAGSETSQN